MSLGWVAAVLVPSTAVLVAFLVLRLRAPAGSAPGRPAEPVRPLPTPAEPVRPPAAPAVSPMPVGSGNARVTVDAGGLVVETRGSGFATGWFRLHSVTWPEVTSLQLDTGTHDSQLSLYATVIGMRFREHLVNGNALSRAEWIILSRRITACTDGRIDLDLRRLDEDRPYDAF